MHPNFQTHGFRWYVAPMCGRFTQAYTWSQLVALYRLTQPVQNLEPQYKITPTTTIDTVIPRDDGCELIRMRWAMIPA